MDLSSNFHHFSSFLSSSCFDLDPAVVALRRAGLAIIWNNLDLKNNKIFLTSYFKITVFNHHGATGGSRPISIAQFLQSRTLSSAPNYSWQFEHNII